MSLIEIIVYLVLFSAITLILIIPALRWYIRNTGIVQQQKHALYIVAAIVVIVLAGILLS